MKLRNAKWVTVFATFTGVLSLTVRAQESDSLVTAPVTLAPAMERIEVPQAMTAHPARQLPPMRPMDMESTSQDTDTTLGGEEAETQSGNANSGSGAMVIIHNGQEQKADQGTTQGSSLENEQSSTVDDGRTSMIRRERMRRELLNEGRLIEKIEEDRIDNENGRSTVIEGLNMSQTGSGVQTVEVQGVGQEVAVVTQPMAAAPYVVSHAPTGGDFMFGRESRLSPIMGYRWTPGNNYGYDVDNQYLFGVALETKVAPFLALEANYIYGRDKIKQPYGIYAGHFGGRGFHGGVGPNFHGGSAVSGYGPYVPNYRDSHEFSANAKLGYLRGTFRPYGLVGLGMLFQKYKIDHPLDTEDGLQHGWKRVFDNPIANMGGGLDFQAARNFAVGARFEYQKVMGRKDLEMNYLYGQVEDRMRLTGSLQLVF